MPEHGFHLEINPNRADERRREAVIGVSEKERGLPHRAVTYDQQFEHIVEILIGGVFLPFWVCAGHLRNKETTCVNLAIDILLDRVSTEYNIKISAKSIQLRLYEM